MSLLIYFYIIIMRQKNIIVHLEYEEAKKKFVQTHKLNILFKILSI
mgnify:FL=1